VRDGAVLKLSDLDVSSFGHAGADYGGAVYNLGVFSADGVGFDANEALVGAAAYTGRYNEAVNVVVEEGGQEQEEGGGFLRGSGGSSGGYDRGGGDDPGSTAALLISGSECSDNLEAARPGPDRGPRPGNDPTDFYAVAGSTVSVFCSMTCTYDGAGSLVRSPTCSPTHAPTLPPTPTPVPSTSPRPTAAPAGSDDSGDDTFLGLGLGTAALLDVALGGALALCCALGCARRLELRRARAVAKARRKLQPSPGNTPSSTLPSGAGGGLSSPFFEELGGGEDGGGGGARGGDGASGRGRGGVDASVLDALYRHFGVAPSEGGGGGYAASSQGDELESHLDWAGRNSGSGGIGERASEDGGRARSVAGDMVARESGGGGGAHGRPLVAHAAHRGAAYNGRVKSADSKDLQRPGGGSRGGGGDGTRALTEPFLRAALDSMEGRAGDWLVDPSELVLGPMIGVGSSAHVFSARYFGQAVAAKRLPALTWRPAEVEAFLRQEAGLLVHLHHPSVIKFYGVGVAGDYVYMVTELCRGSLTSLIERANERGRNACAASLAKLRAAADVASPGAGAADAASSAESSAASAAAAAAAAAGDAAEAAAEAAALPLQLVLSLALGVARGVEFLHSRGVVHRDLKPDNVLLTENNEAKLCDFGISRMVHDRSGMTTAVGTPLLMAPELVYSATATGAGTPTAVDAYSFGVLLWMVATQRLNPYDDTENPWTLLAQVTRGRRPPLEVRPSAASAGRSVSSSSASSAASAALAAGSPSERSTSMASSSASACEYSSATSGEDRSRRSRTATSSAEYASVRTSTASSSSDAEGVLAASGSGAGGSVPATPGSAEGARAAPLSPMLPPLPTSPPPGSSPPVESPPLADAAGAGRDRKKQPKRGSGGGGGTRGSGRLGRDGRWAQPDGQVLRGTNLLRLPPSFRSLIARCWDADPAARPPFAAIAAELQELHDLFALDGNFDSSPGH